MSARKVCSRGSRGERIPCPPASSGCWHSLPCGPLTPALLPSSRCLLFYNKISLIFSLVSTLGVMVRNHLNGPGSSPQMKTHSNHVYEILIFPYEVDFRD